MDFSPRDLHDVLGVVDERIARAARRQPRTEYGSVSSVSTDGNTASVKLLGSADASAGFRVPPTFRVAVNDYVRVMLHPNGDRYIEQNLTANRQRVDGTDVSLASTDHGFGIGDDASLNLAVDTNEIQARNNGAGSELHLNTEGGRVIVNSNGENGSKGLRVMRGGIAVGTSVVPADDVTILLGADVSLSRVAASHLNTPDIFTYGQAGEAVVKTTTQTITNAAWTRIQGFSFHDYNGSSLTDWNVLSGNEIRANRAGLYAIFIEVDWQAGTVDSRRIIAPAIANNAVPGNPANDDERTHRAMGGSDDHMGGVWFRALSANDAVTANVHQSSGGNLNLQYARFGLVYLGDA